MAAAGILFWFMVLASGATLGVHHTPVMTAQTAAAALGPLAGQFATALFALGLLVSALLAVPILAGTSAYVLAETFGWPGSLDLPFRRAPAFYLAVLLSLAVGAALTDLKMDPIALLVLGSLAGGLGTPVTLGLLMRAARDRRVMGEQRISLRLVVGGWLVTAVVTAAGMLYLWHIFAP
jgi:Mn2+/Fe2+ NRAMP family transporter